MAAVALVLSSLVGGGAVRAADQSSDEAALAAARPAAADAGIEQKVNALVGKMTVPEKLQQLQLLSDGQVTDADARAGVGGVFSLVDPVRINQLQHIAVEQSRLHIPILFAYDTIHGYRTIFPAPLGAASAFDPSVAQADATVGARETATVGIKQVYSPMVDVSHEPRWGRIAEGARRGPVPRLGVRGGPGEGRPGQLVRGPGQGRGQRQAPGRVRAAGGRPGLQHHRHVRARLRNLYLPPFKAAIDAGADTVMCSFNAISGVPGCANPHTETDIVKKEWGLDGFIESDYTADEELRACPPVNPATGPCGHGVAADGPSAAALSLNAGTDQHMVSTEIRDFGAAAARQR